jgi:signal transduction histidine kinase
MRLPMVLAALVAAWPIAALPGETGLPFLRDVTPREAAASHPQNWAMVQDSRGFIYAANGFGVLEYDGARWTLLETRGRSAVRALALGPEGRIFLGGEDAIGYLRPEPGGSRFVDLAPLLGGRRFSMIRGVHVLGGSVFFQDREEIFEFRNGGFRTWTLPGGIWRSFLADGRLHVQDLDGALFTLGEDGFRPVAGTGKLAGTRLSFMLPGPGGGLLLGTRQQGLFLLDGKGLAPFPTAVDALLRKHQAYHGLRLADGTLSVATTTGGVFILDASGALVLHIDRATGLRDEGVFQTFQDAQGGLWLATNNGLARVEWPSTVTRFDARTGLASIPWALARFRGSLYAATDVGLLVLERKGAEARFRTVSGLGAQCLGLGKVGDSLLVASSMGGIMEVRQGRAVPVAMKNRFPACVLGLKGDPGLALVGHPSGVGILRRTGGGWADEGGVEGLREDVFALVQAGPGTVWASTRTQALWRIDLGAGKGRPSARRFGEAEGIPRGNSVRIALVGGRVVAATSRGLMTLDSSGQRFAPDPAFAGLFPDGPRMVELIAPGPDGRVWMQTQDRTYGWRETGAAVPDGARGYRWERGAFPHFVGSDLSTILPEADGSVWFAGPDGIFRYDPSVAISHPWRLDAHIRRVATTGGEVVGPGLPGRALPYRERSLRFSFALPSFVSESSNQYQVKLEGYDAAWSSWSATPFKEYTNLPAGAYRFRVRALDGGGTVSGEDSFEFVLAPPWYRTHWAWILWIAAAGAALHQLLRASTLYLQRRNRILVRQVEEATGELRGRNAELSDLNAQLADLNAQKNYFFSMASHDLRNPLNTIVLASELLEEETDIAEVGKVAGRIRREGQRMAELLARFLDVGAIDSGKIKAEPEPIPLAVVALEAVTRFRAQAERKGIALDLRQGTECEAYADLRFTKGILDNLLSNAVKFSPAGTCVTVAVAEEGMSLALSVTDQGPGFTEEDRARLFQRFAKLSARPTGGETSSGLGLSIVRHLADGMKAPLEVQSEPGRGTTFRLLLPRVDTAIGLS